ncbi:MAG: hypothetical protein ACFE89_06465 [Candidatus Hodarchaeota archaeon]
MVFQPASILTTITGELFVQLKQQYPTLKLWTVVERNDALSTFYKIYFSYDKSAFGHIELLCRPAKYSLQDRHIYGKVYGFVSHLQLQSNTTSNDLQTALKDIEQHCRCTTHFKTHYTTQLLKQDEAFLPCEITAFFEELNYQFNIEDEHPSYTQFAHELTQDALTWIKHITPLLQH